MGNIGSMYTLPLGRGNSKRGWDIRRIVFGWPTRYTERMGDQSALQQLIKQRDELKYAREMAAKRSELPVMDEPGFLESNFRHIESIDAQLAQMDETINAVTLLGSPRTPLTRLRDRQKTDALRKIATGDSSPVIRLRAALSIGMRPAEELLRPSIIGQALRYEDFWKYFPQLCHVSRVMDASSVFEAIRGSLSRRDKVNLRAVAARLIRLGTRWERPDSTNKPSEITVTQLLRLTEVLLDRRQSGRPSVPVPSMIEMICAMAAKYPTKENLLVALRCLTAVERRQEIRLVELYDQSPGLPEKVFLLCSLAAARLGEAAGRTEIDDFRMILDALRNISAAQPETERVVQYLFETRARLDPAISRLLTEAIGRPIPESSSSNPLSAGPLARVQLGTALIRAWEARNDGTRSKESFEQLESVLGDFFGLRLRDYVGEIQDYNSRVHEFALDEAPSSKVEVIRPPVEFVQSAEGEVIVKALVKAIRS